MHLEYADRATAQAKADAIHQWMIDNSPAYKASVQAGQTLRWSVPRQAFDADGKVIAGSNWQIAVKTRTDGALSAAERLSVKT